MHAVIMTPPDRQGPGGMPVDIWGNVAKLLSLQDCCKLASTCQALWKLDLPRVMLDRDEPGEGRSARGNGSVHEQYPLTKAADGGPTNGALSCAALEWAAKRWANAQLLSMSIHPGNVMQLSKALACAEADDLGHL